MGVLASEGNSHNSEGGMIRLETLVELKFLNSSFSNSDFFLDDFSPGGCFRSGAESRPRPRRRMRVARFGIAEPFLDAPVPEYGFDENIY